MDIRATQPTALRSPQRGAARSSGPIRWSPPAATIHAHAICAPSVAQAPSRPLVSTVRHKKALVYAAATSPSTRPKSSIRGGQFAGGRRSGSGTTLSTKAFACRHSPIGLAPGSTAMGSGSALPKPTDASPATGSPRTIAAIASARTLGCSRWGTWPQSSTHRNSVVAVGSAASTFSTLSFGGNTRS